MLAKQQSPCPTPPSPGALLVVPKRNQRPSETALSVYQQELDLLRELEKVAVLSEN